MTTVFELSVIVLLIEKAFRMRKVFFVYKQISKNGRNVRSGYNKKALQLGDFCTRN